MFDQKSRYAGQQTHTFIDVRGRTVLVVLPPQKLQQSLLGFHPRKQGQRLDHMAAKYLQDPQGFWRIAQINNVMHVDQLAERLEIAIPQERG